MNLEGGIHTFLESNECILWEGKPDKIAYVWGVGQFAWCLNLFCLLWFPAVLIMEIYFISSSAPVVVISGGVFVVLLGFYLAFGRIFVAINQWGKLYYCLTNRRAIVQYNISVQSIFYDKINNMNVVSAIDGCGHIFFNPKSAYYYFHRHYSNYLAAASGLRKIFSDSPAFWGIQNAEEVYSLILRQEPSLMMRFKSERAYI